MLEAKARIEELVIILNEESDKYYNGLETSITDIEFDTYLKELEELEKSNPEYVLVNTPTIRVGSDLNCSFDKVKHEHPMLSIGNTYNKDEMKNFTDQTESLLNKKNITYVVEPKIDGLSLALIYYDRKLVKAVTRGDGTHGDDVTENAKTIKDIPIVLKQDAPMGRFEIRGEVYMDNDAFEALNNTLVAKGKKVMQNPRNASAGSLKLKRAKDAAKRPLRFLAYFIVGDQNTNTHSENLDLLKQLDFNSNTYALANTSVDVMNECDLIEAGRDKLSFDIDGAVVKVNDLKDQKTMGNTSKSPRWIIAYKYNAVQIETKVTSVDYQVGRTGAVTPVANLEPVRLCGTTVKRATLHNFDEVKRLNLHIGDTVLIEKGGEIIPKIINVVDAKHDDSFVKVETLKQCPICSSLLVKPDNEKVIRCENLNCPAQVQRLLEHFVSRQGMNIEGVGPSAIEQLIEQGVNTPLDLYKISRDKLERVERMGTKSIKNFLESVHDSKERKLENFIFALGIRYVGKGTSKRLAKHYHNLEEFMKARLSDMINIEDIGNKTAESIHEYLSTKVNSDMLKQFIEMGMSFETKVVETSSQLKDKTLVITGTLPTLSRSEAAEMAENAGAKVSSSIGKKTNYLLAGEKAGSKLEKAKKLGVNIITESQFMDIING